MHQHFGSSRTLLRRTAGILAPTLFLTGLLLIIGIRNYLLFHTLAELFAVIISAMIFFVAWHTRRLTQNSYLMVLGSAYLAIGVLDLVHTLVYHGMGLIPGYGANAATQLWVAARYIESISFLAAPLLLSRKLRSSALLAGYLAVLSAVLLSIFAWPVFPQSFREAAGLTPFKIISEYIICGILAGAMVMHTRRRDHLGFEVYALVMFSMLATVASEVCFTLYGDPYGVPNMIGHLLKIASFYLVYRATIQVSLSKPFELLFRELKNSETLLRSERDRAQAYFDTAGAMLMVLDTEGLITDINRAGCAILGDTRKHILGSSWFDSFVPADEREKRKRDYLSLMTGGEGFAPEGKSRDGSVITSHGERRIISWRLSVLRDEQGRIAGAVESGDDVTELRLMQAELEQRVEERTLELARSNEELQNEIAERKKIEQELLDQHHMLETMLNHQNLLANVASQLNASVFMNKGIHLLLEEIAADLGIDTICLWSVRRGDDAGMSMQYFPDTCFSRDPGHRKHHEALMEWLRGRWPEHPDVTENGELVEDTAQREGIPKALQRFDFTMEGIFPVMFDQDVRGFIGCFRRRATDWRPEERELLKTIADMIANDWKRHYNMQARIEAEQKQTAAVRMAEQASRLASIGTVAGGITHEINQPLTAIKVNVDSILYWDRHNKGMLPSKFIKSLSRISGSVDRINQIIQHMRRFWTGPAQAEKEAFDLNEVIRRALGLVNSQLIAHQIETVLDLSHEPLPMMGSALQMEQVIVNLVVNAKNAHDRTVKDRKLIAISTSCPDDGGIELVVRDNGPGLPVDVADTLFDPFYSTGTPGEGMGLGLAIVKRIIGEHNGAIRAANDSGGGAVFTIRFPPEEKHSQAGDEPHLEVER